MGPFGWLASVSDWASNLKSTLGRFKNLPVVCVELSCVRATSSNGVALLFAAHGSDEQIFGVNEQILGRDQSDQVVAVRPTNFVGSLLQRRRCAPSHLGAGDDRVSGTDADRHDDISHNGSSEFGGNADSADTADLVAPCKSLVGPWPR